MHHRPGATAHGPARSDQKSAGPERPRTARPAAIKRVPAWENPLASLRRRRLDHTLWTEPLLARFKRLAQPHPRLLHLLSRCLRKDRCPLRELLIDGVAIRPLILGHCVPPSY